MWLRVRQYFSFLWSSTQLLVGLKIIFWQGSKGFLMCTHGTKARTMNNNSINLHLLSQTYKEYDSNNSARMLTLLTTWGHSRLKRMKKCFILKGKPYVQFFRESTLYFQIQFNHVADQWSIKDVLYPQGQLNSIMRFIGQYNHMVQFNWGTKSTILKELPKFCPVQSCR